MKRRDGKRPTVLVVSQVFVPDPASVGQHIADAAVEIAGRGLDVTVLTADRGYEDPNQRYARQEDFHGVRVRRLRFSSFGKHRIRWRLAAQVNFLLQATLRGLFTRRLGAVLISTSPPTAPLAALIIGTLRRVPVTFWVMDLNPDQAIETGAVREGSVWARLLDWVTTRMLRSAASVIALDHFMAERLAAKADLGDRLAVIPPWPHDEGLHSVPHDGNPFRHRHSLEDKFVVMYSGNHSTSHPLRTALDAAVELADEPDLVFAFVGGGKGKQDVERYALTHPGANILTLPYQPLAELRYSLSAADLHLVSMGDGLVGIVHPCKIYGAMAVERPVLALGGSSSHLSELVDDLDIGWRVSHGDVAGAVEAIRTAMKDPEVRRQMGTRAVEAIDSRLSQDVLCGRLVDRIVATMKD